MSDEEKLPYCTGCRDDFYNGKNQLGIKRCWNLEKAEVVYRKFVHYNDVPPWNHTPIKTLSCHRKPRHIAVDPDKES